jgi:uncharacterized protein (DUF486 family)
MPASSPVPAASGGGVPVARASYSTTTPAARADFLSVRPGISGDRAAGAGAGPRCVLRHLPFPLRASPWGHHPESGPLAGLPAPDRPLMPSLSTLFPPSLAPIMMLVASNVFMTFAWYGHLKYKSSPLLIAILASWGIAFFEYCLAVPANRIGSQVYSTAQLKTMQEVITLLVFAGFSVLYLKEPLGWNHLVGFTLIAAGAYFIFQKF